MTEKVTLAGPNKVVELKTIIPRLLIIGDSGTHKTFFLKTIPEVFVFDFDKGLSVAKDIVVDHATFKDAPRNATLKDEDEGIFSFGDAWTKFIGRLNYIGTKIDKGTWEGRPIAIDSLTTMANCAMAYVLSNTNHTGIPQIQHWGAQMQLIEMIMDQISAWPVPIIVTAHVQRNTNDLTQVVEYLPLVTGKLAGKIPLYFDECYYTKVSGAKQEKSFTLQTESDSMYKQAKTRFGVTDGIKTDWPTVYAEIINPNKKYGKT